MANVAERIEQAVGPDDIKKAGSTSTQMLLALAATGKHVYEGTVPAAVIARRRAQGRRAKAARKLHRGNR